MTPAIAARLENTVAARLGLRVADVLGLPRFVTETASEPVPRHRRAPRVRREPAPEADAVLDRYELDARVGVADALIAKKAGTSQEVVRYWRRRKGIRGRSGRTPRHLDAQLFLRTVCGEPATAVPHATRGGRHGFEIPPYVLRVPLDYGELTEVVSRLNASGFHVARLASAIGISEFDLLLALSYLDPLDAR